MVGAHLGLECVQGRVVASGLRAQLNLPGASRGRPSAQEGSGGRHATRSRRGRRDLGNPAALHEMRSLSLDFDSVPTPQAPRAGGPKPQNASAAGALHLGRCGFHGPWAGPQLAVHGYWVQAGARGLCTRPSCLSTTRRSAAMVSAPVRGSYWRRGGAREA